MRYCLRSAEGAGRAERRGGGSMALRDDRMTLGGKAALSDTDPNVHSLTIDMGRKGVEAAGAGLTRGRAELARSLRVARRDRPAPPARRRGRARGSLRASAS